MTTLVLCERRGFVASIEPVSMLLYPAIAAGRLTFLENVSSPPVPTLDAIRAQHPSLSSAPWRLLLVTEGDVDVVRGQLAEVARWPARHRPADVRTLWIGSTPERDATGWLARLPDVADVAIVHVPEDALDPDDTLVRLDLTYLVALLSRDELPTVGFAHGEYVLSPRFNHDGGIRIRAHDDEDGTGLQTILANYEARLHVMSKLHRSRPPRATVVTFAAGIDDIADRQLGPVPRDVESVLADVGKPKLPGGFFRANDWSDYGVWEGRIRRAIAAHFDRLVDEDRVALENALEEARKADRQERSLTMVELRTEERVARRNGARDVVNTRPLLEEAPAQWHVVGTKLRNALERRPSRAQVWGVNVVAGVALLASTMLQLNWWTRAVTLVVALAVLLTVFMKVRGRPSERGTVLGDLSDAHKAIRAEANRHLRVLYEHRLALTKHLVHQLGTWVEEQNTRAREDAIERLARVQAPYQHHGRALTLHVDRARRLLEAVGGTPSELDDHEIDVLPDLNVQLPANKQSAYFPILPRTKDRVGVAVRIGQGEPRVVGEEAPELVGLSSVHLLIATPPRLDRDRGSTGASSRASRRSAR